jgi:O-antigen/teichoic acid export membrane protein
VTGFARSVGLNFAGEIGTLAIGFFSSLLIARWLGPADRGLLSLIATSTGITMVFVNVGVPMAVWYYASRPNAPVGALLGNSLLQAALVTAVLVPAAWLLEQPLSDALAHGRGGLAWVLGAAVVPLTFLEWSTRNQLTGQLRFGLSNALVTAEKLVLVAAVVVFLYEFGWGVSGVFAAQGAGFLVGIFGALVVLLRQQRPRLDFPLLRRLLGYGARVQVGSLFQLFNSRFDVLILQFYRPLRDVGYYVIAQVVAELVMLFSRSFQSSVLSFVSHESGRPERQAETTALTLRHHALLSAGAILVDAAFAPLLIIYGYGSAFRPAIVPIFVLLPGVWFLGNGLVIANDLSGRARPGLASVLSGVAVAVTVTLDFALIPPFGVMGAAVASVVAYVVFGVISVVALSRVSGVAFRQLVPRRSDLAVYVTLVRTLPARARAFRAPAPTEPR